MLFLIVNYVLSYFLTKIDGMFLWTTVTPLPLEIQMTTFVMTFSLGYSALQRIYLKKKWHLIFCSLLSNDLSLLSETVVKKTPKPLFLRTERVKWAGSPLKYSASSSTRTRKCPLSSCTVSQSCVELTTALCSCR